MSDFPEFHPEEPEALTIARLRYAESIADEAAAISRREKIKTEDLEMRWLDFMATDNFHKVYRFNSSVSEKSVSDCIRKLTNWSRTDPGCEIEVIFNSPGGSIIDGMALFDFLQGLRNDGHRIITGSAGMAASMAGILLQAGDHRWIGEQTWMLIHRSSFGAGGATFDVEDRLEFIKRIEDRIVNIFTTRSSLTSEEIREKWDRKDWWITSEEALEVHLVDEVKNRLIEGDRDGSRDSD